MESDFEVLPVENEHLHSVLTFAFRWAECKSRNANVLSELVEQCTHNFCSPPSVLQNKDMNAAHRNLRKLISRIAKVCVCKFNKFIKLTHTDFCNPTN